MPAQKRSSPAVSASRRRSGRLSSTPKKSNYFEGSDEEGDLEGPPLKKRGRGRPAKSAIGNETKKREDSEEDFQDATEDSPEEDEGDDDDEFKDDSENGANGDDGDYDEDDEIDESAPMKTQIIPLEVMRDTGGVDYADEKLHKNTSLFLRDLKANNKRSWLKSHDGEYRRALKDWNSFVDATTLSIIDLDETIPELPVKDVSFRIHRDIRFSKDPTPYKPHFSAAWSRTGRKGPYACYYVHCEPKKSFIGGGLWCPERDHLAKLRRSIDRHPGRWREALNNAEFRGVFFGKVKGGEDKVLDAFAEKNKEYSLKKRPQGYEMDHRDIKLLRLKSFTVGKAVDDEIFWADDAQERIAGVVRGLVPFVEFLNRVVMPDPLEDSSSEEEEEEQENGEASDGGE